MFIKKFNENIDIQKQIDYILDKINKIGYDKLSNYDKKILDKYKDDYSEIEQILKDQEEKYKAPNEVTNDLNLSIENDDLAMNIGRYVKLKVPENGGGLIHKYGVIYEIVGLQKMWGDNEKGQYVFGIEGYRLSQIGKENDFGRPGNPNEIIFVDLSEKEALEHNKKVMDKIKKELEF
jgi:hypothetical protein